MTVLLLTAGAVGCATSPIFAFGVLAPSLVEDLGLSRAQVGFLLTALYLSAALSSGRMGRVTDRLGGRLVTLGLAAVVAASYLLVAASPGLAVMLVAAAGAGLALAAANPATNLIVVQALPVAARSAAMGWKQAGVPLASTFVGVSLPVVAVTAGWRAAAVVAAGAALAFLVVAWVLLPPRPAPEVAGLSSAPAVGLRPLRWLCGFALLMGGAGGVANAHYALFATSEVGVSRTEAGLAVAAMGLVGAVCRIGWARLADGRRGPAPVLVAMALIGVVATGVLVVAPAVGPAALWAAALLSGASLYAWNGVLNLIVVTVVPVSQVGVASGQVMRFFYLGLLSTPIAFGLSVDLGRTYAWGWIGQGVVLASAAVVAGREALAGSAARRHARCTPHTGGTRP